jgi:hypothetical protein
MKSPASGSAELGLQDQNWSEGQWQQLLADFVNAKMVTWREVASLTGC